MVECLLCLYSCEDIKNCIQVDSSEWKEFRISNLINQHLWPLDTVNENSWLCSICWQELYNFHKFYTRIEEVQNGFKSLSKSEAYVSVENIKTDAPYIQGLLEPEIDIEQTLESSTVTEQKYEETTVSWSNDYEMGETKFMDNKSIYAEHTDLGEDADTFNNGDSDDDIDKNDTKTNSRDNSSSNESECDNDCNSETDADPLKPKKKSKGQTSHTAEDTTTQKSWNQPKINRRDKFLQEHYKITCNKCHLPFDTFVLLCKHFSEKHNERGFVACCGLKFFHRGHLIDHINYHLNPEYFKCKYCGKVFNQRRYLSRHILSHESKKFQCDVCDKNCGDRTKLERHKLTHLSEEEKNFPCAECGKFFANEYVLSLHHRVVHLNTYLKVCEICGQSTYNSNTFKRHMERHDLNSTSSVVCGDCGLVLAGTYHLKRHRDVQHPVGGKRDHICHICQKVSPTMKALKKHIQCTHVMGYNYKCTICEKEFKRSDNFKAHMSVHTGEPLYSCPWCPKTFNSNGNMHSHRKKIHPVEWEESIRKKYSGNLPSKYKRPVTTTKSTPSSSKH